MLSAATQLLRGFTDWRRWAWLGLYDVRLVNRRSFLGMWWPTLSLAIFAYGIGHLWAGLLNRDLMTYMPHMATGWMTWQFLQGAVVQGGNVFIQSKAVLQESILAPNTVALRMLTKLTINLFLGLLVIASIYIYLQKPVEIGALWMLLGVALNLALMHGVMLSLGILCTRFRDLLHLIEASMRMVFFVTPIIWLPNDEGLGRSIVVDINPFYYMIETIRTPLVHGEFPTDAVLIVAGMAVGANVLGFLTFAAFRRRLVYWL